MTKDQGSKDGTSPSPGRPAPGERTRPDHPVRPRGDPPDPLVVSPAPSGPGMSLAKTLVVSSEEGQKGAESKGEGAAEPSIKDLFDDEDMPTFHVEKQDSPIDEASLLLTPQAIDQVADASTTDPRQVHAVGAGTSAPNAIDSQSSTLQTDETPRGSRKVWPVVLMIVGAILIVAVSAVVGALIVLHSTSEETPDAPSSRIAATGPSETSATQEAVAQGASPQPVPVPIETTEPHSQLAVGADRSDGGAGGSEGAGTAEGEAGAGNVDGEVVPDAEGEEGSNAEGADGTEGAVEGADAAAAPQSQASGSDLASVLAPLTEQVRMCTRREQGYNPRALTIHLVPVGQGRERFRGITPPTPPRVVGCIARLLDGVTLPQAPASADPEERVTYTFELR